MAVKHREDSIKEMKSHKHSSQQTVDTLGKQLAKSMLDGMKKDQVINSLGKVQAQAKLEIISNKNEIKALKSQIEELKGGNE